MAEVTTILCPICHKENILRPRARFCQHCGQDIILNNDAPTDDRRYYITRIIKKGGQGAVYQGIDAEGRVYAIKEMIDRFTDPKERDEALNRFNSEAELLQSLGHPRIPRVYSHFTDEGRHYLTMDFIQGEDLDQIVERRGPLPEAQVLEWADQICDVLHYLHQRGLIYRDMKPSNVMIERSGGSVKLVDFGIAKVFKHAERGAQIGTPGYAPPEQYQGFATPASDIYSLAATLHHVLTGRDPTKEAPFSFPPVRNLNPKVSRRTSDALEQALRMRPEERFGTIAEFRAMLRPLTAAPALQPPTQVRVAPPTVALPGAAKVAPPQPVGAPVASQSAPQRPPVAPAPVPLARPAPQPQSARPAARPAPASVPVRRKGGWFGGVVRFVTRLIMTVILLVVLVVGVAAFIYIQYPDLADRYLPPLPPAIERVLPQSQLTPAPATLQPFTADLETLVPADADSAALRAAFLAEYERRATEQFGVSTTVAWNAPPAYIGNPERVGEENGQVRYRVAMSGHILAP